MQTLQSLNTTAGDHLNAPLTGLTDMLEEGLLLPQSLDGLRVDEAEYWEKYYGSEFSYEWNDGFLEAKPMTNPLSYWMYDWFWSILGRYLSVYPVGRLMGLDYGFRLRLPHKISIRKPDLIVILHNNPTPLQPDSRTFDGVFDLCIESLSDSAPSEIIRDTEIKKKEYEAIGVKEYYILDANEIHTRFYYLGKNGKYVDIFPQHDDIIQSRILPGFQFRKRDLLDRPSLEEMAEDDVYKNFVPPFFPPFYQAEKQRALQERQRAEQADLRAEQERQRAEEADLRAEQEKQRAEQEKQRAEESDLRAEQSDLRAAKLAARLKALGISPDDLA